MRDARTGATLRPRIGAADEALPVARGGEPPVARRPPGGGGRGGERAARSGSPGPGSGGRPRRAAARRRPGSRPARAARRRGGRRTGSIGGPTGCRRREGHGVVAIVVQSAPCVSGVRVRGRSFCYTTRSRSSCAGIRDADGSGRAGGRRRRLRGPTAGGEEVRTRAGARPVRGAQPEEPGPDPGTRARQIRKAGAAGRWERADAHPGVGKQTAAPGRRGPTPPGKEGRVYRPDAADAASLPRRGVAVGAAGPVR